MPAAAQELLAAAAIAGALVWLVVRFVRARRVRACPGCASASEPLGRRDKSRSLPVLR